MYGGSSAATWSRIADVSSVVPERGTRYATSWSPVCWSVRRTTAAWATDSCSVRAASISPGSMRNPRTFTWKSLRPTYSSSPVVVQRAWSPVR